MTQDEKEYFKILGSRVAQLRKGLRLTQVQLAKTLGISQQMVASYEVGRRRIPVSMLPSRHWPRHSRCRPMRCWGTKPK